MRISRRNFLKASGAATAMTTMATGFIGLPASAATLAASPLNKWPGRVVVNFNNQHAATMTGGTVSDKTILKAMVDDAIKMLTGQSTVAEAWRSIFPDTISASSKIAIKINILNSGVVPPHPFVVMGVIDGLLAMNVGTVSVPAHLTASSIYIYDGHCTGSAKNALGYNATNFPGVNIITNDSESTRTGVDAGARGSQYANTLYTCNFLINMPGVRGHGDYAERATLGFKSHYGTYPTAYHEITGTQAAGTVNGTPPYLRDINCTGPVYNKTVLTLFNAIYACRLDNGPSTGGSPDQYYQWAKLFDPSILSAAQNTTMANTLILSTDPAAAEALAYKMMRRRDSLTTTVADLPAYLKSSAGITGLMSDGVSYNIGVIDEALMNYGEIANTVVNHSIDYSVSREHARNNVPAQPELRVFPNPANPHVFIDYRAPQELAGQKAHVEIYDVQGRIVWHEATPILGVRNRTVWQGVDNAGRGVGSGQYVVRVSLGGKTLKKSVTLVR
ncbi:MAG: T9SS type A sorting domain-containing protein [Fibrobacterota bacterium]